MKIVQFRMSNASTTPAGSVSRPASKAAHDLQVRLLRRLVSHERFVSIASESYRSRCVARYGAILQGSGPFLDEAGDRHMPLRVSPINRPRDYGEIDLDLVLADESNRRIGLLGRPGAGKTWLMLRTAPY